MQKKSAVHGKTHVSLKHQTQSSTGALAPFSSAGSSCCSACFICHHPVVLQLTHVWSQIFFLQQSRTHPACNWSKTTPLRTVDWKNDSAIKSSKIVPGTCMDMFQMSLQFSIHSFFLNVTYDATMDTPRPGAPARPHHWGPWAAHPGHWLAPGRQMTWTVLEDGVQVQYMNSGQNSLLTLLVLTVLHTPQKGEGEEIVLQ